MNNLIYVCSNAVVTNYSDINREKEKEKENKEKSDWEMKLAKNLDGNRTGEKI